MSFKYYLKDICSFFIFSLIPVVIFFPILLNMEPVPHVSYFTIILNTYNAGKWVQTPCFIISSNVSSEDIKKSEPHGGGYNTYTVYHPDISYSYNINNINYKSSQYNFLYFLSKKEAEDIVKDYPSGKKAVCYVNSSRPEEVVLNLATIKKVFNLLIFETACWGEPCPDIVTLLTLPWIVLSAMICISANIMRKKLILNGEFDERLNRSSIINILFYSRKNKE